MNKQVDREQKTADKPLTGKAVLVIFLVFFGMIFLANGTMVFTALKTFSGVETPDAYRKGRTFNATLEARQAQKALGWQVALEVVPADEDAWWVRARFADREGMPLDKMRVSAVLWDPTNAGGDRRLPLAWTGEGRYAGIVALPRAGNWQVRLRVDDINPLESDEPLEWREDVILKP